MSSSKSGGSSLHSSDMHMQQPSSAVALHQGARCIIMAHDVRMPPYNDQEADSASSIPPVMIGLSLLDIGLDSSAQRHRNARLVCAMYEE